MHPKGKGSKGKAPAGLEKETKNKLFIFSLFPVKGFFPFFGVLGEGLRRPILDEDDCALLLVAPEFASMGTDQALMTYLRVTNGLLATFVHALFSDEKRIAQYFTEDAIVPPHPKKTKPPTTRNELHCALAFRSGEAARFLLR